MRGVGRGLIADFLTFDLPTAGVRALDLFAGDCLAGGRLALVAGWAAVGRRRAGGGVRLAVTEPRGDVEVRASLAAPPRRPPPVVVDLDADGAGRREIWAG